MLVRRAVVLAAFLAGCNGSGGPAESKEVTLRVTASHGVGQVIPGAETGGAAAYAADLVFEPLEDYVRVVQRNGTSVFLETLSESGREPSELARALRFDGLEKATAAKGGRIRAHFETRAAAEAFAGWRHAAFAFGPFEVEEQNEQAIRLRARQEDHPIEVIEIVAVEEEQQWRRLLAHDVDVVPVTDATRARRLEEISSIRVLPIPPRLAYAVVFNTKRGELEAAATRRALARTVDRPAVARIACGDPGCAVPGFGKSPRGAEEAPGFPEEITALVLETDDVAAAAAGVLRHQLSRLGISVDIQEVPRETGFARIAAGRYDVAFVPLWVEMGEPLLERLSAFGYEGEALSAAIERGDRETARQILAREVPYVPLFEARYFAAVDARFCGGAPRSETSWRWLADLYPCEASE